MSKNENSIMSQPITEIIKKRKSIRSYKKQPLSDNEKVKLENYIQHLKSPFSSTHRFNIVDSEIALKSDNVKLGTYGVIKGASSFISASLRKDDLNLEALGYDFESIVLYATALGLGTCWLGGTFKKSDFAKAIALKDNEILPIISPVGYINDSNHLLGSIVRAAAGSNSRKSWKDLFYHESLNNPLTEKDAANYKTPLEMVRLAPSASNKQPWRIVKEKNFFHFYLSHTKGYAKALDLDIQRIDMGIAMCHFELTLKELGLSGNWEKLNPNINISNENIEYIISWTTA